MNFVVKIFHKQFSPHSWSNLQLPFPLTGNDQGNWQRATLCITYRVQSSTACHTISKKFGKNLCLHNCVKQLWKTHHQSIIKVYWWNIWFLHFRYLLATFPFKYVTEVTSFKCSIAKALERFIISYKTNSTRGQSKGEKFNR